MVYRLVFARAYLILITREKTYAHCLLRLIIEIDRLAQFRFLKEFARRQHSAFDLRDETQIINLTGRDVLDLGCGMGYWGLILRNRGCMVIGIDVFLPYLRLVKMLGAYNALVQCSANALPFKAGHFDTALVIEVIEHVNKQGGLQLLRQAKQISERVIVTTPQYFSSNENIPIKSERHLSHWIRLDFEREGFITTKLGQSLLAVYSER